MPNSGNSPDEAEVQKLEFEREKLALEDKWRHKTWLWTIGSAILTGIVTITVAWLSIPSANNASASDPPEIVSTISLESVRTCYDSLQRLRTLATAVRGQTQVNLQAAIQRHHDSCDELFLDLIEEKSK